MPNCGQRASARLFIPEQPQEECGDDLRAPTTESREYTRLSNFQFAQLAELPRLLERTQVDFDAT